MDVAAPLAGVLAAVGLAGAAGLNAHLPLLMGAVLVRLDVVELADPFGALSGNAGIAVLAVLFLADFVGDKIPGVDHVLHVAGTVLHPVAGAIVFVGGTGDDTSIPALVAVVLGAVISETLHVGRAALRPVSTTTTAGMGNPFLSLAEDGGSLVLTVLAFAVPVLALLLVLALLAAVLGRGRRRLRHAGPG